MKIDMVINFIIFFKIIESVALVLIELALNKSKFVFQFISDLFPFEVTQKWQ